MILKEILFAGKILMEKSLCLYALFLWTNGVPCKLPSLSIQFGGTGISMSIENRDISVSVVSSQIDITVNNISLQRESLYTQEEICFTPSIDLKF